MQLAQDIGFECLDLHARQPDAKVTQRFMSFRLLKSNSLSLPRTKKEVGDH